MIIPTNVFASADVDENENVEESNGDNEFEEEESTDEQDEEDTVQGEGTKEDSVNEDTDESGEAQTEEKETSPEVKEEEPETEEETETESEPKSESNEEDVISSYIEKMELIGFKVDPNNPTEVIIFFQSYYGLAQTGEIDKEVQAKVDEVIESPLQNGNRDTRTIKLKSDLKILGFTVPGNGTSLFGSKTEKTLKEFQNYYGLVPNGIADSVTLHKIEENVSTPLQMGKRHSKTILLKKDLAHLGFKVPGNGTNYYGKQTKEKVMQFQREYKLVQNGIVDDLTEEKINELLEQPMANGLKRKDVIQLKKDLNVLGFKVPGNGTNYFGPKTERVLKEFQNYYGLTPSGIADNPTIEKIKVNIGTPLQMGKRHSKTIQLKKDLAYLGYSVPGNGTNYYGKETSKKVKQFQKSHNLVESGLVDEITEEKIQQVLNQPMGIGLKRKDVIQLKKDLKTLGFKVPGNGTNYFGAQTEKQVKAFQKHYGLSPSGIVDQPTEDELKTLLKTPLQSGYRDSDTPRLKRMLAAVGYPVPGNGTNYYGAGTAKKVREFQKSVNLPVSGITDPITFALLEDMTDGILMVGMRDERVIQLKKDLAFVGLAVPGNGTYYYGTGTEKKVKQFQKHYGLKQTGSADKKTLEALEKLVSNDMQNGNRNNATIQLKKDLKRLGFKVPGNGTSLYGKQTEKKVKEFQKYYGLLESGIADEKTLNMIEEVLKSPLQNGKRHKSAIQLKYDLALLGYKVSNNPTTLFGKETEKQVKRFQKANKLVANGIVDPPTRKKLDALVKKNTVKIFIDPGHGGSDIGATGFGLQEKNLTLDIALQTRRYLNSEYLGVDVNMSRTTDVFIKLEDRSIMANNWGADYFVSVHTNAHNGSAHGFESFIHNGKVSKETVKRQQEMHNYIMKNLAVHNRGKKTANFNVLRNTNMPAILLEYLFIDNYTENQKLKDPKYRKYLGEITAEAIAHSFNLKKK